MNTRMIAEKIEEANALIARLEADTDKYNAIFAETLNLKSKLDGLPSDAKEQASKLRETITFFSNQVEVINREMDELTARIAAIDQQVYGERALDQESPAWMLPRKIPVTNAP